jgi:protein-disulfide isomerase
VKLERTHLIAGGVALVALLGGLAYWIWGGSSGEDVVASGPCKPVETFEVTAADYAEGKADAPITMIEYASMTCPHCAHFTQEVLPQIRANYIEKGYVRYVFREFPLDRVALAASVAGRCLAHEAYLPYVEMMYSELQTWATQQDQRGAIKEMARRAGMSGDEFEKCLSTEVDAKKIVAAQNEASKKYCIGSTPTFLLNGKGMTNGDYSEFDEKLRAELKAKGVVIPAAATPTEGAAVPADASVPAATPATDAATPAASTPPPATTPAAPAPSKPAPGTPSP